MTPRILRSIVFTLFTLQLITGCGSRVITADTASNDSLAIIPDYCEITLPPNIAPINFTIDTVFQEYQVVISSTNGNSRIVEHGDSPQVSIPMDEWHEFALENRGGEFFIDIALRIGDSWVAFPRITNRFAQQDIDGYLVYRLIYPGYESWRKMGIYERDLSTFTERPIIESFFKDGDGCVNCHSFQNQNPDNMLLQLRGKTNPGTYIRTAEGGTRKIKSKIDPLKKGISHSSWNPRGRYIAFSTNELMQYFHLAGSKTIEGMDHQSDMVMYDHQTNTLSSSELIFGPDFEESQPVWNNQGDKLFFIRRRPQDEPMCADSMKYNLCSMDFDSTSGRLSNLKIVINADSMNRSVSMCKPIPGCEFMTFTMGNSGLFAVHNPDRDLYLLNLETLCYTKADKLNSPSSESYHSWSKNGRWIVFSSTRLDGQWVRPYIAYFDPQTASFSKPFLMPQQDQNYYLQEMCSYNVPELIESPIRDIKDIIIKKGEVATNIKEFTLY